MTTEQAIEHTWTAAYEQARPGCRELYDAARRCIAGGVAHDFRHGAPFPLYIKRGEGARIWDADDNELLDFGMGNAALLLGHAPPRVVEAIGAAAADGYHFGHDHPLQIQWAQLIQQLIPSADRVRFVSSGTEATMLAIRAARAFTKRDKILRFEGHYHGWHDVAAKGMMIPFDVPTSAGVPTSTLDSVVVAPADLDAVEKIVAGDPQIGTIILEPSGGSWGTTVVSVEFNRVLRKLTQEHGIVLIFDEIVTGFRYSPGGYQGLTGITPDLTTLAKITCGGMAGGAVAGRADIMQLFDYTGDPHRDRHERVQHLGTFNANPLVAAAGVATLKEVATGAAQTHADRMADLLRDGMEKILVEKQAAGYMYGDSSIFHIYLESADDPRATDRAALRTTDPNILKGMSSNVVAALQRGLQIRGASLLSYNGGVTSSAHTEQDIGRMLDIFDDTVVSLVSDDVVARLP